MFRWFAETAYKNMPSSEGQALKDFLSNSHELAKMKELALSIKPSATTSVHYSAADNSTTTKVTMHNECKDMVTEIDNALTFSDILKITERFDFENSTDPSIQKVGASGMNFMLRMSSYVNNEACFAYYASTFRSNAVQEMAKLGYNADMKNPSENAINSMNPQNSK
ncbi:MAG: hypothetical protein A3F14_05545 [Gammaproteobacteria bacterium RIFCSPHIGHO2_12_FULL_43_28]|nr:MAG: hypothetical protein A3F14_05545 [Gammaproteobacteria bacterium RIFCSPHIGHO2_12_FULL_43_28]